MALRIILKDQYESYESALLKSSLLTLKERRDTLSLSFAQKCLKSKRTSYLFPLNSAPYYTRNGEKFFVTKAKSSRLAKSVMPHMQRLLKIISTSECRDFIRCFPGLEVWGALGVKSSNVHKSSPITRSYPGQTFRHNRIAQA